MRNNTWKLTDFGWRKKTVREIIEESKTRRAVKQLEVDKILFRPKK